MAVFVCGLGGVGGTKKEKNLERKTGKEWCGALEPDRPTRRSVGKDFVGTELVCWSVEIKRLEGAISRSKPSRPRNG